MGIQFEQSKTLFIMFADTSTPKAESPLRQESHLMYTSRRRTEMTCKKSTLSLAAWGFLAATSITQACSSTQTTGGSMCPATRFAYSRKSLDHGTLGSPRCSLDFRNW